ncbi:hypothetical protein CEE45_12990 [Candidatus Heimdallarchaeota archaeon B3_Heim]|nr:MAG: hypothetical protein CEE45_12990 [Candidatus Heimdallarchaeota archaeon B3_Heim]
MRKYTVFSLGIIIIVFGSTFPLSTVRASNDEMTTFYGSFYDNAVAIRNYYLHSGSGALREVRNDPIIKTKTNLLIASTLLTEFNLGGSNVLQDIARSIVHASTRYFDEAYTSDNAGWVSFFDFSKNENSYVKSQKFTHDQVLMILSLALSYPNLASDDEFRYEYQEGITETLDFINRNLLGNENGWIDSLFAVNRTSYTKNQFRLIENICWTIWSILTFPDSIDSPFSLDDISQILDLIHTDRTYNGAVFNVLSPDWSSSDDVLKLRTNALYGIINLMLYEKTAITNFLDRGKTIFDFLRNFMYDRGFGGFFDVVDKDGMLIVQRKSVVGNTMACLLSSKLGKFFPSNKTIETTLVRTNRFIEENLLEKNTGLYYITSERSGLPLTQHSLMSDAVRLWQRGNSLHIVNGSISSEVSIGEKIKIDFHMYNPNDQNYTLYVVGDEIDPFNTTTTDSHLSNILNLKDNAKLGYFNVKVQIKILSGIVDQTTALNVRIGSDRRLPQGLVYLIALGILVGIVVVVRYPPRNLEELLARLSSISAIEEESGGSHEGQSLPNEETSK